MKERGHSGSDSSPVEDGYASDRWETASAEGSSCDNNDHHEDSYTDSFDEASENSSSSSSSSLPPSAATAVDAGTGDARRKRDLLASFREGDNNDCKTHSSSSSSSSSSSTPGADAGTDDARKRGMSESLHDNDNNDANLRRQGNGYDKNKLPVSVQDPCTSNRPPVVVRGAAAAFSANLTPPCLTQKMKTLPLLERDAHRDIQLGESRVTRPPPSPPPPPPRLIVPASGVDGAQQTEFPVGGGDSSAGKNGCEYDNNNNTDNFGWMTPGDSTDMAAAAAVAPSEEEPLSCGASCSSVDLSESGNVSLPPMPSPSEESELKRESEEQEQEDDVEFADMERYLALLGVPPAFPPRRGPPPSLNTPTPRRKCWSEKCQQAGVTFSTPPVGGDDDSKPEDSPDGPRTSPGGLTRTTTPGCSTAGCSSQPVMIVGSNNNSSAVSPRALRRNDNPSVVTAAQAAAAAAAAVTKRRSEIAVEGSNGSASLVDGPRKPVLKTDRFHAVPVNGGQTSTITAAVTTTRRQDSEKLSGDGKHAISPPLDDDPPAAQNGTEGGADSANGGSSNNAADGFAVRDSAGGNADSASDGVLNIAGNGFVRYPPWREARGPSFSDDMRAVASGIRRQTRYGSGNSSMKNAERNWNDTCRQRSSQGGGAYHKMRLNRSKRFVRRSMIGRIGAMAAMEKLKYPPGCSSRDRAPVEGALPWEGSAKKNALKSISSIISDFLPLKPPAHLGDPKHSTQNRPLIDNLVNVRRADDCQDHFSRKTGRGRRWGRDRASIGAGGAILGEKECMLSTFSCQPAPNADCEGGGGGRACSRPPTTTADCFGSKGGRGVGSTGVVARQEEGMTSTVIGFGFGGSPVRRMGCLAGHPNHHDGDGGSGGVESSESSIDNSSRREVSNTNNDSSSGRGSKDGSSSSSSRNRVLDGDVIRTFARKCLAESRML